VRDNRRIKNDNGRRAKEGATQVIGDQIKRLTSQPPQKLGFAMIAGLVISLWSANGGMKAMFDYNRTLTGSAVVRKRADKKARLQQLKYAEEMP
jgi:hypothetical protein